MLLSTIRIRSVPSSVHLHQGQIIQIRHCRFWHMGLDLIRREVAQWEGENNELTRLRYWDLSYNNFDYSYIDYATSQGYCTLSFDRLGIGNSSHGELLNEIQASLEVAATKQLTTMLRNGQFPSVPHAFSRIVHVDHSFGSGQTYALANSYPDLSDGIVLTGFSMNSSFIGDFLADANFMQANSN